MLAGYLWSRGKGKRQNEIWFEKNLSHMNVEKAQKKTPNQRQNNEKGGRPKKTPKSKKEWDTGCVTP